MNYTTAGRAKYSAEKHANAMHALREAKYYARHGNEHMRRKMLESAADFAKEWADSILASTRQPPKARPTKPHAVPNSGGPS